MDAVVAVWSAFGETEKIRAWIARTLGEPRSFVHLIFSQMSEVSSSAPPYRYRTLREDIEPIFDLGELVHRAKEYLSSGVIPDEDDLPDVERFVEEAEKRLSVKQSRPEAPEAPNERSG